ncbi:uncharacterized protein LOC106074040 isoform X2 [Biomphalaria glabrata]|uniref:Uncharacterized protein LOC106074040 isoform X2 n=1 Tax=Biomphalaria glabrata TaxID=6526 RepID=A0A9W2YV15_BIOGL|nr:uncharacterized protein LOC106074040 isoform X2 [Biomphalaria glabrata]
MYVCIAIVYMLLFIDLLESTMSPTLTLDKVEFFKNCELWSPIFIDKLLCFGGKVSFLMSSSEIGEAVHITVTSADSKITNMSAHIAFDDCRELSLKTKVLEEIVCACTSKVGNKSFTYLCAMTFNTSYSGSIINAFLEYLNGSHAKDVLLKLPAINKEESTSLPESDIPTKQKLENSDTWKYVSIGLFLLLAAVIVIFIICFIYQRRTSKKEIEKWQKLSIVRKDKLTKLKKERCCPNCQKEKATLESHNESEQFLDPIQDARARYLNSMLTHSDALQELGHADDSSDSDSLEIPMQALKVRM